MTLHSTIQQRLDQAAVRWKWLRLLEYSATLGIVVTVFVLLLGALLACGWLTSKSVTTFFLILFLVGTVLTLGALSLFIVTWRPEEGKLARVIEQTHPVLMDSLNTLVFLRRQKETPCVRSFYHRVEAQATTALAGQKLGRLFSPIRAAIRLCILFALILLTVLFYLRFTPLTELATASVQLDGKKPLSEKPFEMPIAELEPAKATAQWGDVRITRPGRNLVVTRVEDVPLEIEASASDPLGNVGWYTSINGGQTTQHNLPLPPNPKYAVYEPVIELEKFGLSDWDVLSYNASMTTEEGDSFVSDIYFIEVRPFTTELSQLPDAKEGKCYSTLNQLTGLIERQQEVIRETHRQLHFPESDSELRRLEQEQLADSENGLAEATAHLIAVIATEFDYAAVEKPVFHLGRAEESLRNASDAFGDCTGADSHSLARAKPKANKALAELVAARKELQECFTENPSDFTTSSERGNVSASEPAEILEAVSEFCDLANAYKLKSTLDEQIELLKRIEQEPDTVTERELQEACQKIKEVSGGLKRIAEEKPTSEHFSQELREALADENKQTLDSQCDSLRNCRGSDAKKKCAGAAKASLQQICQAFTASQPKILAQVQQEDSFQPGGQRSLDRGIKHLESLLQSNRDSRYMSAEDRQNLQEEALTNIKKGIESLDYDTKSSGITYKMLRDYYTPEVTLDPKVIQRLIAQLDNLSVEFVNAKGEKPGEPEISHFDSENMPQAYRERIRKYFEKLSER